MMRQLEHALGLLAERADAIPVDMLVGRLESQLDTVGSEPATVVAPLPGNPVGPVVRDGLSAGQRQGRWRGPLIAAGSAAAILVIVSLSVFLINGDSGDVVIQPAPTPTTIPDNTTVVPAPIDATWSLLGISDGWLTDPVMSNGQFFATRKSLASNAQPNSDGLLEGIIEGTGKLWTSLDGVTWIPAEAGELPPDVPSNTPTGQAGVVVRTSPIEGFAGFDKTQGLWATSDGTSWREIALQPAESNWMPSVASGTLGWVVYSPPYETAVVGDGSVVRQGPRDENLGLWYTPDTEAWFDVTDLGPLAGTIHHVGDVGVIDTAVIVRDTDILVYVHIARNIGFGNMGNPHTEIWQLDLSPREAAEAFDFSTQDLCKWFSSEDITQIVASTYEELGVPPMSEALNEAQDQNSDCAWVGGALVTLSHNDERRPVESFKQHAALDDTVRVSIQGNGNYGLTDGLEALLIVDGQDEQLWFGHATPERLHADVEMITTVGLTIANKMLQEMEWTGTN
jgi:hypothetical protein